MHSDSDSIPFEDLPRVRPPRQWRRMFETVCVIGSLFLGGFGSGYFWAARNADAQMLRQRGDHLSEISRLQLAWGQRIDRAAGAVTDAAVATTNAAVATTSAAEAVGEAADQVGTAAKTATSAAITAKAAAKATAAAPAQAPATAVNNTIKRANEKLQGARP
jgi:hypothetical protein